MAETHYPLMREQQLSTRELQPLVPLDVARLMTRCALLAMGTEGCMSDAEVIVDGLQPTFGEYAAVAMAKATVTTATGNYADAVKILERLSVQHPHFSPILCAYAMLKKELGLSGWQVLAQKVIKLENDPQASAIAVTMLEQAPKLSVSSVPMSPTGVRMKFA